MDFPITSKSETIRYVLPDNASPPNIEIAADGHRIIYVTPIEEIKIEDAEGDDFTVHTIKRYGQQDNDDVKSIGVYNEDETRFEAHADQPRFESQPHTHEDISQLMHQTPISFRGDCSSAGSIGSCESLFATDSESKHLTEKEKRKLNAKRLKNEKKIEKKRLKMLRKYEKSQAKKEKEFTKKRKREIKKTFKKKIKAHDELMQQTPGPSKEHKHKDVALFVTSPLKPGQSPLRRSPMDPPSSSDEGDTSDEEKSEIRVIKNKAKMLAKREQELKNLKQLQKIREADLKKKVKLQKKGLPVSISGPEFDNGKHVGNIEESKAILKDLKVEQKQRDKELKLIEKIKAKELKDQLKQLKSEVKGNNKDAKTDAKFQKKLEKEEEKIMKKELKLAEKEKKMAEKKAGKNEKKSKGDKVKPNGKGIKEDKALEQHMLKMMRLQEHLESNKKAIEKKQAEKLNKTAEKNNNDQHKNLIKQLKEQQKVKEKEHLQKLTELKSLNKTKEEEELQRQKEFKEKQTDEKKRLAKEQVEKKRQEKMKSVEESKRKKDELKSMKELQKADEARTKERQKEIEQLEKEKQKLVELDNKQKRDEEKLILSMEKKELKSRKSKMKVIQEEKDKECEDLDKKIEMLEIEEVRNAQDEIEELKEKGELIEQPIDTQRKNKLKRLKDEQDKLAAEAVQTGLEVEYFDKQQERHNQEAFELLKNDGTINSIELEKENREEIKKLKAQKKKDDEIAMRHQDELDQIAKEEKRIEEAEKKAMKSEEKAKLAQEKKEAKEKAKEIKKLQDQKKKEAKDKAKEIAQRENEQGKQAKKEFERLKVLGKVKEKQTAKDLKAKTKRLKEKKKELEEQAKARKVQAKEIEKEVAKDAVLIVEQLKKEKKIKQKPEQKETKEKLEKLKEQRKQKNNDKSKLQKQIDEIKKIEEEILLKEEKQKQENEALKVKLKQIEEAKEQQEMKLQECKKRAKVINELQEEAANIDEKIKSNDEDNDLDFSDVNDDAELTFETDDPLLCKMTDEHVLTKTKEYQHLSNGDGERHEAEESNQGEKNSEERNEDEDRNENEERNENKVMNEDEESIDLDDDDSIKELLRNFKGKDVKSTVVKKKEQISPPIVVKESVSEISSVRDFENNDGELSDGEHNIHETLSDGEFSDESDEDDEDVSDGRKSLKQQQKDLKKQKKQQKKEEAKMQKNLKKKLKDEQKKLKVDEKHLKKIEKDEKKLQKLKGKIEKKDEKKEKDIKKDKEQKKEAKKTDKTVKEPKRIKSAKETKEKEEHETKVKRNPEGDKANMNKNRKKPSRTIKKKNTDKVHKEKDLLEEDSTESDLSLYSDMEMESDDEMEHGDGDSIDGSKEQRQTSKDYKLILKQKLEQSKLQKKFDKQKVKFDKILKKQNLKDQLKFRKKVENEIKSESKEITKQQIKKQKEEHKERKTVLKIIGNLNGSKNIGKVIENEVLNMVNNVSNTSSERMKQFESMFEGATYDDTTKEIVRKHILDLYANTDNESLKLKNENQVLKLALQSSQEKYATEVSEYAKRFTRSEQQVTELQLHVGELKPFQEDNLSLLERIQELEYELHLKKDLSPEKHYKESERIRSLCKRVYSFKQERLELFKETHCYQSDINKIKLEMKESDIKRDEAKNETKYLQKRLKEYEQRNLKLEVEITDNKNIATKEQQRVLNSCNELMTSKWSDPLNVEILKSRNVKLESDIIKQRSELNKHETYERQQNRIAEMTNDLDIQMKYLLLEYQVQGEKQRDLIVETNEECLRERERHSKEELMESRIRSEELHILSNEAADLKEQLNHCNFQVKQKQHLIQKLKESNIKPTCHYCLRGNGKITTPNKNKKNTVMKPQATKTEADYLKDFQIRELQNQLTKANDDLKNLNQIKSLLENENKTTKSLLEASQQDIENIKTKNTTTIKKLTKKFQNFKKTVNSLILKQDIDYDSSEDEYATRLDTMMTNATTALHNRYNMIPYVCNNIKDTVDRSVKSSCKCHTNEIATQTDNQNITLQTESTNQVLSIEACTQTSSSSHVTSKIQTLTMETQTETNEDEFNSNLCWKCNVEINESSTQTESTITDSACNTKIKYIKSCIKRPGSPSGVVFKNPISATNEDSETDITDSGLQSMNNTTQLESSESDLSENESDFNLDFYLSEKVAKKEIKVERSASIEEILSRTDKGKKLKKEVKVKKTARGVKVDDNIKSKSNLNDYKCDDVTKSNSETDIIDNIKTESDLSSDDDIKNDNDTDNVIKSDNETDDVIKSDNETDVDIKRDNDIKTSSLSVGYSNSNTKKADKIVKPKPSSEDFLTSLFPSKPKQTTEEDFLTLASENDDKVVGRRKTNNLKDDVKAKVEMKKVDMKTKINDNSNNVSLTEKVTTKDVQPRLQSSRKGDDFLASLFESKPKVTEEKKVVDDDFLFLPETKRTSSAVSRRRSNVPEEMITETKVQENTRKFTDVIIGQETVTFPKEAKSGRRSSIGSRSTIDEINDLKKFSEESKFVGRKYYPGVEYEREMNEEERRCKDKIMSEPLPDPFQQLEYFKRKHH